MIEKPKQYYDTRRHQLYYQWSESEYFSHQEPVYNRTREYIEALEAENTKLRKELADIHALHWNGPDCTECPWFDECDTTGGCPWLGILADHMRELGIEVG